MNKPAYLYKYQKLTAHSLASIINGTMWFAKPSAFNDPFDCALKVSQENFRVLMQDKLRKESEQTAGCEVSQEIINKIRPEDAEHYDRFCEKLSIFGESIGVLSLSKVSPGDFQNAAMLMWAHYADQHRGLCLEYDCREKTDLWRLMKEVEYSERITPISIEHLKESDNSYLESTLFTKAEYWRYEKEWRVVMPKGSGVYPSLAPISSIIFGARMPKEDQIMVYVALKERSDIKFKAAHLARGEFALEIESFDQLA